jgi:hypothetical protein
MSTLVLLGPQRFRPTLRDALQSLGVAGPVAVVTAGWQERESEDRELADHLACEVADLRLYHRGEDVLARDPELGAALHERQEELRERQALYRLRLDHQLEAARELMRRPGRGSLLDEQRRAAIRGVRALDRQHLSRIRAAHEQFERQWRPGDRPVVARHREEIAAKLEPAAALCIAGGHVAILVNRLRLFDPFSMLRDRPVVAWSAGAMAVCDRVVLFHDSPPQGAGNAEIFDSGLALARGLVPLPHARRRLKLGDRMRVALFARRFSPAECTVLEPGARVDWDGERWTAGPSTVRLGRGGRLQRMSIA